VNLPTTTEQSRDLECSSFVRFACKFCCNLVTRRSD